MRQTLPLPKLRWPSPGWAGFLAAVCLLGACATDADEGSRPSAGAAELRAWTRAATAVQEASDASRPGPYGVDAEAWTRKVEACPNSGCARDTLHMWLEDLTASGARPKFAIPRSRRFSTAQGEAHNSLQVLGLAEGWRLFMLEGDAPARVEDGAPFMGGGVFVARERDGVYRYRDDDGAGFDIFPRPNGWRVVQVGPCACGAHISLSGDYL